jgi:hypothetical protein
MVEADGDEIHRTSPRNGSGLPGDPVTRQEPTSAPLKAGRGRKFMLDRGGNGTG